MYSLKFIYKVIILLAFSMIYKTGNCQKVSKNKIAIFIPIYLDDAFDGNTFKIWNNKFPKSMIAGLEYYNGTITAINELKKNKKYNNLEFTVYDYKSDNNSLPEIFKRDSLKLSNTKLFIGCLNNRNELKQIADFAALVNIPFISSTFPNDGGITKNPNFFLLNSTINSHCKVLYNSIKSKVSQNNFLYITRNGSFEEMITKLFKQFDSTEAFKIKPITLVDTFYNTQLIKYLDTTKNNIILCGSVNEGFAIKVANAINSNKKYKTVIYGLPTWDDIKTFNKKDYTNIEFIHTSSFFYDRNDSLINNLSKQYTQQFDAKPTDQFFKAYETTLRFAKLISVYNKNAVPIFSDDLFKIYNSLSIEPKLNDDNISIDYYENKNILTISRKDGNVKILK